MKCYYCGAQLDSTNYCPECEADVRVWRKIVSISNNFYNEGLAKANVRDLSGAVESLNKSLRCNKQNMDARNLLGLVYYEMGEVVKALSEWVISKSLIPEDNPASEYLSEIQKNTAELENMNQTIKKFNQSLSYCQDGSYDLAVIQLKKVLQMNPKMVKAHQLLALLYMREEKYDLALTALNNAEKIDVNNTNTQTYKQECKTRLAEVGPSESEIKEEETVTYQSGNETIIRPVKNREHTALRTVVNLLIGAAIGIAVVWFLLIPEVKQRTNTEVSNQLVEANQDISAKEQTIVGLQEEVDSLTRQMEDAQAASDSASLTISSYSDLFLAYDVYSKGDYAAAAETMAKIDRSLLDELAQGIYDNIETNIKGQVLKTANADAMAAYENGDYETAIAKYLEVLNENPGYNNGETAFYLAYAYYHIGDKTNALKWFQTTMDNTDDASYYAQSRDFVSFLQPSSGTVDTTGTEDATTEETAQ